MSTLIDNENLYAIVGFLACTARIERMFESLMAEARAVNVPVDGDALREMMAVIVHLSAKFTQAVGAFDAAEVWDLDDATSLVAWLAHECGLSRAEAARWATKATRLHGLPETADAWADGRLTSAQVDSVLRATSQRTAEKFADNEPAMVSALASLDARDTDTVMAHWAQLAEAELDETAPHEPDQWLHASRIGDRLEIRGSLTGTHAHALETVLRIADSGDFTIAPAVRRADALGAALTSFLDNQGQYTGGRNGPHVNVVIDIDHLSDHFGAHTLDGVLIDPVSTATLLCHSEIERVVMAGRSTILDLGRTTRLITPPLYRAIAIRDRGCRFPGCDRPPGWCEAHHVRPWEFGGPTSIDNLALFCPKHHHRCHQPGWSMKLLPDGELHITKPDGTELVSAPPLRC